MVRVSRVLQKFCSGYKKDIYNTAMAIHGNDKNSTSYTKRRRLRVTVDGGYVEGCGET